MPKLSRTHGDRIYIYNAKPSITEIIKAYGSLCHLCGHPLSESESIYINGRRNGRAATRDHIIPEAQNGSWIIDNLRPSHWFCNLYRSDLDVTEILKEAIADLFEIFASHYINRDWIEYEHANSGLVQRDRISKMPKLGRTHGESGYQNGCRCSVCTEDHRLKCAAQQARRRGDFEMAIQIASGRSEAIALHSRLERLPTRVTGHAVASKAPTRVSGRGVAELATRYKWELSCTCGEPVLVEDGRTYNCPACDDVLVVPSGKELRAAGLTPAGVISEGAR